MCNSLSFMVFRSLDDIHTAVQHLVEHDAGQLMREGQCRKGQLQIAHLLDGGGDAVRRADDKADLAGPGADLLDPSRQLLRGKLLINPGSVHLPRVRKERSYAILKNNDNQFLRGF